jgi:predicted Fe-Mo cluster-binding NifX family protein
MKILITATRPELEAQVDPRFGRAAFFIVLDTETMKWRAHSNDGIAANGGAGAQAAQFAASHGVEAVVSGDFGPNAYLALEAADIKMRLLGESRTVWDAISRFTSGTLQEVRAPTSAGRHGGGH